MKKVLLIGFVLISINSTAQHNNLENECRKRVKLFFEYINLDTVSLEQAYQLFPTESFWFCEQNLIKVWTNQFSLDFADHINLNQYKSNCFDMLIQNRDELYSGYKNQINDIIDSSIFMDSNTFFPMIVLNFPNSKKIYFVFIDIPDEPLWFRVFLTNGDDFIHFLGNIKLRRYGVINDMDGYTNIRKEQNFKSEIVGKIKQDELFAYTPNTESDWWRVYDFNPENFIGYVHKSKIIAFGDLPKKEQDRLIKKYDPNHFVFRKE